MKTQFAALSLGLALGSLAPAAMAETRAAPTASSNCDRSSTDRVACLQDERGARIEQRRNGLVTPQAEEIARNLRARCEPLPADDKQACLRRMAGEGTRSGSVEQGGVLRELVIVEPAPVVPVMPVAPVATAPAPLPR